MATNAYTDALRNMWYFYLAIAALGIVCSACITRNQLSKSHEVQKTGLEEQEKHRKEEKRLNQMRKSGDLERGVAEAEREKERGKIG